MVFDGATVNCIYPWTTPTDSYTNFSLLGLNLAFLNYMNVSSHSFLYFMSTKIAKYEVRKLIFLNIQTFKINPGETKLDPAFWSSVKYLEDGAPQIDCT